MSVANRAWTERSIGVALFNQAFARKHVVCMANYYLEHRS